MGIDIPSYILGRGKGSGGGGGGGSGAAQKNINFIDYDGKILYSYTTAEFAALTAMPENPSHAGLTAQGWNWTLEKAKAYAAKYENLWIGQMYITDDGKTRVYIRLEEGRLEPYLGIAVNGTAVIEWGDGTNDTVSGTSIKIVTSTKHIYPAPGEYVITIDVTGSLGIVGNNAYNSRLLWKYVTNSNVNRVYQNAVQKVELGRNVSIGDDAFRGCYSLTTVIIPDSVTSIGGSAFQNCRSLTTVIIPDSVTSIGNYAFNGCYGLMSVIIPDSVTSIGSAVFQSCYSLTTVIIPDSMTSTGDYTFSACNSLMSIVIPDSVTIIGSNAFSACDGLMSVTIPDSVTNIGNGAFSGCYGLGSMRFAATTPPTVASIGAWTGIPTDCIIYVPSGTLAAYTSAANYPSSSSYTYVEY